MAGAEAYQRGSAAGLPLDLVIPNRAQGCSTRTLKHRHGVVGRFTTLGAVRGNERHRNCERRLALPGRSRLLNPIPRSLASSVVSRSRVLEKPLATPR